MPSWMIPPSRSITLESNSGGLSLFGKSIEIIDKYGVHFVGEFRVNKLQDKNENVYMVDIALATPEDNAYIESFFKTLKKEEVYFKNYKVFNDIKDNLPRFIDEVYNTKRLHSSLGYKTPSEFENEVLKLKPADRPVQTLWGYSV